MPSTPTPTGRVTKRTSLPRAAKKPTTSNPNTHLPPTTPTSTPTMPPTAISTTPPGPVYFWKPGERNGYLGQWYPSSFTHEGDTYATAEMWMMMRKARLFEDEKIAKSMLRSTDPKVHKALGRKVKGFEGGKWDAEKSGIVEEGNYLKFTVSSDAERLRSLLLGTGDRELVEASSMDRIWGIGFAEKDAEWNREVWGQNLLGKALVVVRERLREEGAQKEKEKNEGWEMVDDSEGKGKQNV